MKTAKCPLVSVIIPTLNAGEYLPRLISVIGNQKGVGEVEIIIIDSGSTDDTVAKARGLGVEPYLIPRSAFRHSSTRNLGARLARGSFLAFLSQDAMPQGAFWLRRLVRPLMLMPKLAAAYSRQLPESEAPPWELWDVTTGAPPRSQIQCWPKDNETDRGILLKAIKFSNVASCLRRTVWEKLPFDESLPAMEDQAWVFAALKHGYTVFYSARSQVRHSHHLSLKEYFYRHYQFGIAAYRFLPRSLPERNILIPLVLQPALDTWFYILRHEERLNKMLWIFPAVGVRLAMVSGHFYGKNTARLQEIMVRLTSVLRPPQ